MSLVLQSTITAVTIYRNGALVTRSGTLPAPESPSSLHMPGMPLLFASESLRIRVEGGSADAVEELSELSVAEGEDPADEAARRALKSERARLTRRREAWRARQGATGKVTIKPPKRDEEPVLPSVALWLAVEELVGDEQVRCAEAIQKIDDRLQEISEDEDAIRRRDAAGRATRYTRTLATTLTPDGADTVHIEVAYFIPGARWAPVYRVYVDTAERRVRLWMGARVAQATGENWSGVPIAVSTADLTRSARIPTLTSWRIGRASPRPSRWRPLPEGLDGLFADFDAAPRSPSPPPPPKKRRPKAPVKTPPPVTAMEAGASVVMDALSGAAVSRGPISGNRPSERPVAPMRAPAPQASMAMPKSRGGRGGMRRKRSMTKPISNMVADEEDTFTGFYAGSLPETPSQGGEIDPGRLLDYAWLRLAPASDRRRRGKLLPVDLSSEYRAFIEAREGDLSRYELFSTALRTLRQEQNRIWQLGLPSGCFDVRNASFHHRYPSGPAVDLPSDGRFHQIAILEEEADCELLLRCVPRQDPRAFRYARLDNPLSRPLLPGPMQVYLDGAYTVTGQLTQVGASGELRLNLGVEELVRVARNAEFHQSERGMITSTSTLDHRVVTEIRSRLPWPVTVEVFERLPLEEGVEGVELSLEDATPLPKKGRDPDGHEADGALSWRLSLASGGAVDIRYRYTINISARKELIGGNRREP